MALFPCKTEVTMIKIQYPRQPCQHCKQGLVVRRYNLCWSCFYNPKIRELYKPPVTKVNRRGSATEETHGRPLPPHPTSSWPGTAEKVEVMRDRLLAGYHIHHPLDAGAAQLSSVEARRDAMREARVEPNFVVAAINNLTFTTEGY